MEKTRDEQLKDFKRFLKAGPYPPGSPLQKTAEEFLLEFPWELNETERQELTASMEAAFRIKAPEEDIPSVKFDELIPKHGWFRNYYKYTLTSEPPTVFHFMSSFTLLGAALERNVYFDKGFYRVYPNVATVLIAPTGKCRKTSATNIALKLAREVGLNVLSDRLTPEALVDGLMGREAATGIVYAPELAVFLGRSKYLEGMVPLLTTLFDAPDRWHSKTIGRGDSKLAHVALSFLGASTIEWFVEALPREAFSGGFMSRLLFVVQEDTDRTFALPERMRGETWEGLREQLQDLMELRGEVTLDNAARSWYLKWYEKHQKETVEDEKFAGYHERKPDHMLRMAMLLRMAENQSKQVLPRDFEVSLEMLDWLEKWLPKAFGIVAASQVGGFQQKILTLLYKHGGELPHSVLLKKCQHLMNSRTFHECIDTLRQSHSIVMEKNNLGKVYKLM